eukprot:gene17545-23866_t
MPGYEESVTFLKNLPTTEGNSIYEHLSRVLAKVLEDKPANAIDLLESSLLAKKPPYNPQEASPLVPPTAGADAARTVQTANLFGYPDLPIDPDSGEPIQPDDPNDYESEDVLNDGLLFDALGVGLGYEEMYNVSLAVKKLGEDAKRNVQTVRFFGKFFGLQADYYVFETTLKDPPEIPEAPEGQVPYEAGTGVNNYTYFVCNYLGGPFSELPYVKPDEIKAARTIKKFLTGKLTSHVSTYPVFEGTEANYLRCQIARIAATTVCCPAGMFEADEEGAVEKNEEWEGLAGKDATVTTAWVHRYPHLKMQGRCELFKREPPEDEDEPFEETEEEKEVGPEPLAPLEKDVSLPDGGNPPAVAWTPLASSSSENIKKQVGGLRSNLWPGAYMACKDKAFSNMYVGWGIKTGPFVPLPPPSMAKEWGQELVEQVELPPKPAPPGAEDEEEEL